MRGCRTYIEAAVAAVSGLLGDTGPLEEACRLVAGALSHGKKLLICGNGGSAADAEHLAGELVCRFRLERLGLPAVALSSSAAVITAVANDYSFDRVFARQVEAIGCPGDILLAISTSGSSPNVLLAADAARARDIGVVAFVGAGGGELANRADLVVRAPSSVTSHAQEALMIAGHALCEYVERALAGEDPGEPTRKGP